MIEMVKTSANSKSNGGIRTLAVPMTLILSIGTGGDHTFDYQRIREARLIFDPPRVAANPSHAVDVVSAANDLRFIRSVLKITQSGLARALGVSRQSLYNWKSGAYLKPQNLFKLANLKSAAETFVQAKFTVLPYMLDHKLSAGKSLLDQIADGRDGGQAASELINKLATNAAQRHALDELLARNISRKPDAFDFGAPAVREE
jgi:DNA-binding XRE family transcriptional regulator